MNKKLTSSSDLTKRGQKISFYNAGVILNGAFQFDGLSWKAPGMINQVPTKEYKIVGV
jgi:hypothetical protein